MCVRLILCVNSEAAKRDEVTGKLFAIAEEREGGPITLDMTNWDFKKADCRTRCRKLIENSKPLLLIGSPIDSRVEDVEQTRAVLHMLAKFTMYKCARDGIFFTHIRTPQRVVTSQRCWIP